MALPSLGALWNLVVKVDRLLDLDEKHGRSIAALQDQVDALANWVTKLEAREEIVVAEAKGAAAAAAMGATNTVMADLARRVGGLEVRDQIAREDRQRLIGS